jgi:hypothetical protein
MMEMILAEKEWLLRTKVYPESSLPLYERWGTILSLIPEARYRSLSADFSDVFRRAYGSVTETEIAVAIDLTLIQLRWFMHLGKQGTVKSHWLKWNSEAVAVWRDKLIDRLNSTAPDVIEEDDDGEFHYIAAHEFRPTRHDWRH